jgi:hypothetical protein
MSYKERLGGWFAMLIDGTDFIVKRNGDDRGWEASPLEYRYRSYAEKALDLVDQLLDALIAAGDDLDAVAAAVPYLLDLTIDYKFVKQFAGELRQEGVRAAELAMFEIDKDAVGEACQPEAPPTRVGGPKSADIPILGDKCRAVLKCLYESKELLNIEEIAEIAACSRQTAGNAINKLIELELAQRPEGPRGGAGITSSGRECHEVQSLRQTRVEQG